MIQNILCIDYDSLQIVLAYLLHLDANCLLYYREDDYFIYKVGEVTELRLGIRVRNKNEDAHEAMLTVILPDSLKYINVESVDVRSYCN